MRAYKDQHFLTDPRIVARIADILDISGRRVLEIGPGEGILTKALLDRGATVISVELDRRLIDLLTSRFSDKLASGELTIIPGDAVKVPLPPFDIVMANLPYSISSPITFRLLEIGFESAILMYQKEFADRMMAPPGSRECGRLSIMLQTYARANRCFDLPPGAFSPPPAVHSTVMWIEPREPLFPITDKKMYEEIVRELFSRRRKTVRSTLHALSGKFGKKQMEDLIETLDTEILSSRPEALYLEDFATISNRISA
ncbi:16S rRNA (adenine(1518)-N(6)/adenine(1519)-N(6))-dimethyltransferase RsmA [Methanospirillum stamsii]|uniref:Probable ribosomal RNA small subunit methyltransferase A n=1 Tax=Methanospirillum stamsii TaxID=1277351 RepID=A0A2V2NC24_9EURY|nr:16S rRNA (adenine(1518)-N(6)/adenine(1519)-N(6))-dimethyltransferase RsmA [Methanospirillum stamsii]PWR76125.1 16S rRNA (adenine(1518)-N(6)/adenine(1519)-N(6))-dimethyltransferase [Methanospirillum stamsii]